MPSEEQQQAKTGPSSTDSLPEENLNETSLREQLELDNNVRRLLKMAGVKSIGRNLKAEDNAVKRDIDAHHQELWGGGAGSEDTDDASGDDMEMMAARDIIINQAPQPEQKQPEPEPEPEPQPEPEPAVPDPITLTKVVKVPGKIPGWQAALAAASLAAGGAGVGFGLSQINKAPTLIEKTAPIVYPDKSRFDIGLLPPDP